MNKTELQDKLKQIFPSVEITDGNQFVTVVTNPTDFFNVAKTLKNNESLAFDYLFCVTGLDNENNFEVIYHLKSTSHLYEMVLKVQTENRDNPVIESVCSLWNTANFHEREIFDFLGIKFNNHPNLQRLFLDDSFGHPLRKDYKDEVRMIER